MKKFMNQELLSALKSANSLFLCTHIMPDGDAIGSLLAAGHMLEAMGKRVVLACADDVPRRFRCLPGWERIVKPAGLNPKDFDTALSLDCSDEGRSGACLEVYGKIPVRLQVDHHGTNPLYAVHNEVDPQAPAAGILVARLAEGLGVPLNRDIAVCLYAAISTDTGNFCFSGVDAETFEIMGRLMETGMDIVAPAREIHLTREREYLGLLSRALSKMQFLLDGTATLTRIDEQDFADYHALTEHCDGIVNYGLYIPGVRLTVFMDAHLPDQTKFSIRSIQPVSAQNIAVALGGGGHVMAAGCTMKLPANQALPLMLAEMEKELNRLK